MSGLRVHRCATRSRRLGRLQRSATDRLGHKSVAYSAPSLRGTRLFLSVGNGEAGPFDPPDSVDGNEAFLQAMNIALLARLKQLRIPVTTDFCGPGSHSWPYWERDLHRSLPTLLGALGRASSRAHAQRRAVARTGLTRAGSPSFAFARAPTDRQCAQTIAARQTSTSRSRWPSRVPGGERVREGRLARGASRGRGGQRSAGAGQRQ
jgi:hypothetical protein